jgi:hypothetical protein
MTRVHHKHYPANRCVARSLTFHLDAYVAEQVFRYNNRKDNNDSTRFAKVVSQVTGKRLTYAEVTGKVQETTF